MTSALALLHELEDVEAGIARGAYSVNELIVAAGHARAAYLSALRRQLPGLRSLLTVVQAIEAAVDEALDSLPFEAPVRFSDGGFFPSSRVIFASEEG